MVDAPDSTTRARGAGVPWGSTVATAVVVIAAVAFYVFTMKARFAGAGSPYSLHGDQHQSIGHFWRYARDGAIPPGHLLSDYAGTYHSPPLWWPVMAAMSALLGPLVAAKLLGLLAYALFAVGAALVVARRSVWALGALVAIVALRNPPDSVEQITGGMARSMGPALLYLFLWAFMERRHRVALAALVLQAGIYPSIVIPCGLLYGTFVVLQGPMAVRLRRCAELFVVGIAVIALGLAQDVSAPEWWGDAVTYEEALQMPAWGHGGRFPEVPHRPFEAMMRFNLERPWKALGPAFAPEGARAFVGGHVIEAFVVAPVVLGLLLGALGSMRRWRASSSAPSSSAAAAARFPWEPLALMLAAVAGYWLVRALSFKLFLPSRQLGFTVPFLLIAWIPLLVWFGASRLWPSQRALAVAVTAIITVGPAFAFRGHGAERTAAGYGVHNRDAPFFEAIRKLPLDEEIACDVRLCEYMMALGQHAPYAARNLTHPLRKGYYAEAERRLVEMHKLLYATTWEEIDTFVRNEGVRFMAYRKGEATTLTKRLYRPADGLVRDAFKAGEGRVRLLADPPREALVFRDGDRRIVDLERLVMVLRPSNASEAPGASSSAP